MGPAPPGETVMGLFQATGGKKQPGGAVDGGALDLDATMAVGSVAVDGPSRYTERRWTSMPANAAPRKACCRSLLRFGWF